MNQFNQLFLLSLFVLCLSGCGTSFMQGMAAGMRGYGNYGGYGIYNGYNAGYAMPAVAPVAGFDATSYSGGTTSTSSTTSSSSSKSFCRSCSNTKICTQCHGTGKRTDNMFGTGTSATVKCGICGGSGKCPYCQLFKNLSEPQKLDIDFWGSLHCWLQLIKSVNLSIIQEKRPLRV